MVKKEWSEPELRDKAAYYCAVAEHCEQDVRTKLFQWGAASAAADRIIDYLYDNNYLNTARYCNAFVHDKLLYQGWGKIKMRVMLQAKRLPTSDIDTALNNIDEIEYNRILRKVMEKKKGATPEEVTHFCLSRGFSYSEINNLQHEES